MTYAEKLVSWRWEDLPPAVQAQAKRCLKDIVWVRAPAAWPCPRRYRRSAWL
jgi:hypothetical protein